MKPVAMCDGPFATFGEGFRCRTCGWLGWSESTHGRAPQASGLNVYLASAFDLSDRVQALTEILEAQGHVVTVKWWSTDGFDLRDKKRDNDHPDEFYADPICRLICERDVAGVRDADALVIDAADQPRAYNGANIEYGMALALGKPCFAIGQLDNSALYYPVRRCGSVDELLTRLDQVSK